MDLDGSPHDIYWLPNRGQINVAVEFPMLSSPEAVGLIDFTAKRGAKERAAVFQGALLPDPMTVLATVKQRLATYLPEDDLAGAMKMLEERGWDATETVYSTRATEAKRDWRAITAATYGVRVAADWRPDGWLADFDHMTVQIAEAAVTDARDALDGMHRVQAVSEADAARAQEAEKYIPVVARRIDDLETARRGHVAELAGIPVAQAGTAITLFEQRIQKAKGELHFQYSCPHCGGSLAITDNITGGQSITVPEDRAELEQRIEDLDHEWRTATENRNKLQEQAKPLNDAIQDIDREINERRMEHTNAIRDAPERWRGADGGKRGSGGASGTGG